MNKFVLGALALTSASSLAYAGGSDWSELDRSILSLTSSQGTQTSMFGLSGFVRARGARSNDVDVDKTTTKKEKLSGFSMDNARVVLDASQGDFGVYIALEGVETRLIPTATNTITDLATDVGTVTVLDAYATAGFGNGLKAQMGFFRAPFLWSALIEENNMLLLDRTFNGQVWDDRQDGVQVSGYFDQAAFWVALQNGVDGVQDDYMWTGRVAFSPLGHIGMMEGAYGANPETGLTLGAAYADDSDIKKGSAWCVDGTLTQGGFSLHAELVDYEDDVTPESGINVSSGALNALPHGTATGVLPAGFHGSETPWSATAGLLVNPNIELVLRYEDLDDSDNTTDVTVGVNFYSSAGHKAKFTLQGSRARSDENTKEVDTVAFGVTVGV